MKKSPFVPLLLIFYGKIILRIEKPPVFCYTKQDLKQEQIYYFRQGESSFNVVFDLLFYLDGTDY